VLGDGSAGGKADPEGRRKSLLGGTILPAGACWAGRLKFASLRLGLPAGECEGLGRRFGAAGLGLFLASCDLEGSCGRALPTDFGPAGAGACGAGIVSGSFLSGEAGLSTL